MSDDDDLRAELRALRSEVASLRRRVAALEEREDADVPPAAERTESDSGPTGNAPPSTADETPPPPTSSDVQPPTNDVQPPTNDVPTTSAAEDASTAEETSTAEEANERTAESPAEDRDWERDVGIKWLGLVGGLALVVGVVFFVRLAIDIGLLGPLGRVAVGTLGGLVLLGGGRFAAERQGYVRWGRVAAGAGLAIAYVSCYAAYGFESYRNAIGTPLWAVLLGLSALVAGTVALSIRDGAPLVAGEAFLFGYVTAYLGVESGTFLLTPAYALLLAGGLVAIATIRPWSRHLVLSVLPTYVVVWLWRADVDPAAALVAAVTVAAFGIYLVGGYLLRASDRDDRWHAHEVRALTALDGVAAAFLLEVTVREWFPDAPVEGLAVGAVALALAGAYVLAVGRPVRRDDAAGALAVVLSAGAIGLATGTFATTVGLFALVCVAVGVAALADAGAFRAGAHVVAVAAVYKLLVVDAAELSGFDAGAPLAAATGRPAAFAVGIAVCYGLAWWFREESARPPRLDAFPLAAPYAWAGTGLAVVALGLELSGLGVTVAWAAFGLVLVGAGLLADVRPLRYQGIAVLGLATAKVFLYDTRDLDTLARTLSFLVLGAILLAASYAYARWQGEDPVARLAE